MPASLELTSQALCGFAKRLQVPRSGQCKGHCPQPELRVGGLRRKLGKSVLQARLLIDRKLQRGDRGLKAASPRAASGSKLPETVGDSPKRLVPHQRQLPGKLFGMLALADLERSERGSQRGVDALRLSSPFTPEGNRASSRIEKRNERIGQGGNGRHRRGRRQVPELCPFDRGDLLTGINRHPVDARVRDSPLQEPPIPAHPPVRDCASTKLPLL